MINKLLRPSPYESQFKLLKTMVYILFVLLIGTSFSLMYVTFQKTRPIVILESDLNAKLINLNNPQSIGPITIENFSKSFLRQLNLFDSFQLESSIPIAMNMMGTDLKKFYQTKVFTREFVQNIYDKGVSSVTTFNKIEFKNTKKSIIEINVSFTRNLTYTKNPESPVKKVTLVGKLHVQRLPKRTKEFPYGLKVLFYEVQEL